MDSTRAASSAHSHSRVPPQVQRCITDIYDEKIRRGQLVAGRCLECDELNFPPEPSCAECGSANQQPVELSGRARLCSADVAEHRRALSLGQVVLEEGLTVSAPLVGAFRDPEVLARTLEQQPVEVAPAVLRIQGLAILAFRPVDGRN